ncbi:restriction endonuclease [Candidatus Magnetobacterium bavaricum]|uniref:Restriction endonuclease n=1 Tax=Candidatus Magnetobacterium bavaricum TaxID=29290 RepID=A0A0F3GLM6_9BACT|nr:restriction endonuclease [Candidatus Magnetobacterium bavaricum]
MPGFKPFFIPSKHGIVTMFKHCDHAAMEWYRLQRGGGNVTVKHMDTQTLERDFDLTEIINGVEVMGPSPFGRHQSISSNIYDLIRQHIKKTKTGKVFYSPLDVILKEGQQRLQPDILFIRKENSAIMQDWIRGVPDMVCEIVSKGSHVKDTITKKDIYERYKVPEFWIVFPELETIEVFTIEEDRFKLFSAAEGEGMVKSKVIEGLEIDVREVFVDFSFE